MQPATVGLAVQSDWEHREFVETMRLNVHKVHDFLQLFGVLIRIIRAVIVSCSCNHSHFYILNAFEMCRATHSAFDVLI